MAVMLSLRSFHIALHSSWLVLGCLHAGQRNNDSSQESSEKTENQLEEAMLAVGFELIEHMLDIQTGADEPHALL